MGEPVSCVDHAASFPLCIARDLCAVRMHLDYPVNKVPSTKALGTGVTGGASS